MENSIYNKKSRPLDNILLVLIYLAMIITVVILLSIIGYVTYRGISKVNWEFISTVPSTINQTFGILGNIVNTLYIIIITLLIALPIGIGSAIYGLFGMVFFGITLNLKFSILCGSLTLTIMILPLIIRTTTESLRTVPKGYRDGAIGMGSTKWYMIRTIILPSATPGIVTGTILAMGRIIGESAALLFTAGSVYLLPENLFTHIFNSGGTLTIQMYLSMSKAEYDNAFGVGFVLLCLVFLLNMITKLILSRSKK